MTRPVRYTDTYRFRADAQASKILAECVESAKSRTGSGSASATKSGVIREALAMYHAYHVRGHSLINPNDPNYN